MNKQLRKNEINLEILGTGIIVFGIWSIFKYLLLAPLYNETMGTYSTGNSLVNLDILTWIIIAIYVLLWLFIGFSARGEARGKPKRVIYLVVTAIVFILNVAFLVLEIISFFTFDYSVLEAVITLIIDVTSTVLLFELLLYACRLRKLKKDFKEEGELNES